VENNKALWSNSAKKFFDTIESGKPIIINYRGWQGEIIEKNSMGLVLPPNNPKEAAKKIAEFILDPIKLQLYGQNAKKVSDSQFNRESTLNKILTAIKNLEVKET
jgi:glycosyltransferase involved in cell wall biosynthesis